MAYSRRHRRRTHRNRRAGRKSLKKRAPRRTRRAVSGGSNATPWGIYPSGEGGEGLKWPKDCGNKCVI